MKRQFRHDNRPYIPQQADRYTTAEDAYQHLSGLQSGAEAARMRMLHRMGLDTDDGSAADARERMIQRREHGQE